MFPKFMEGVQYIARSMCRDFPVESGDRRMYIGDNTPSALRDCPGHPSGSHSNGRVFDGYYFTRGEHNFTQRVPREHYGKVAIEVCDYREGRLTHMFDLERNTELFRRIVKIFPQAFISVHTAISEAVCREDYSLRNKVIGDTNKAWNHNRHYHCNLGSKIDYSVSL